MPEGHSLRSLIFMVAACFAFLAAAVLVNRDLLFAPGWVEGLLCGAGIAWAWTRSKLLRALGALLGLALLGALAGGLVGVQGMSVRALFQGASIGFPVALLLTAALEWPRTHSYLVTRAKAFGDQNGLRWLDKYKPRE